jgi:predicted Zn-dependent protease
MFASIIEKAKKNAPSVEFWSLSLIENHSEELSMRQGVMEPLARGLDRGAMVTVQHAGGVGYAATTNLSEQAIKIAFDQALNWARQSAKHALFDCRQVPKSTESGSYASPIKKSWHSMPLKEKIELLTAASERLNGKDDRIVDWAASLSHTKEFRTLVSSLGQQIEQTFDYFSPHLSATAHHKGITQSRSFVGHGFCRQQGLEVLDEIDFLEKASGVLADALELVQAPNCPSGSMDLVLAPDQMTLQIHESIGHPLELDRILGDERNYAGTSFVGLDMIGNYRYGSDLLNVTFDPNVEGEYCSYAYDDDGSKANKQFLIENGILKRTLGGATSQARTGFSGVANSRACNWNRPPIDRMANLNVEPGASSFNDIIGSIEHGVFMRSNVSWSIDDSRNKFQFGCEWAQLIEKGKLTTVVRNPNYRGISATFWRNLKMVGDRSTFEIHGVNNCGKGEPNQAVRVGHASPTCLFSNVDVFGGE